MGFDVKIISVVRPVDRSATKKKFKVRLFVRTPQHNGYVLAFPYGPTILARSRFFFLTVSKELDKRGRMDGLGW